MVIENLSGQLWEALPQSPKRSFLLNIAAHLEGWTRIIFIAPICETLHVGIVSLTIIKPGHKTKFTVENRCLQRNLMHAWDGAPAGELIPNETLKKSYG